MKARTCPNCSYTYSIGKYFKAIASPETASGVSCPSCGQALRVDKSRRLLLALASGAVLLALIMFKNALGLEGTQILLLIPLLIAANLYVYSFDRLRLVE